ncbi:MAG TPA: amidase [Stellaceae bacterium]|nr:amidase [Stellaceae bacterium]
MSATDLHTLTIAEASRSLRDRVLSPVDLVEACLARIDALNDRLHAYLVVTADQARSEAKAAEAEIAAGKYRGPLHGIPIGLKDIFDTAGIRTTGNSRLLEHRVPRKDAESVARLKAAGAIVLGKLATHEFAIGGPSFDLFAPPADNPWKSGHFTGGSSSGSGAAVAAGLCIAATGSDTGGSIRLPASYCGLAGLKPTYGRVSRMGVLPLSQSFDHVGPMAWTSEDCAHLMQVLAGYDPADPASADRPVPNFAAALGSDLKGKRLGIVRHFYTVENEAQPAVIAALDEAYAVLRGLGAELVEVELPSLRAFTACGSLLYTADAYAIHERDLAATPHLYGKRARLRMTVGAMITAADYHHALHRRRELTQAVLAAMAGVDALLTATTMNTAPRFEDVRTYGLLEKPGATLPFNVTGQPALSVCCGFDAAGLPIALQIVGRPFDDDLVLGVGHAYERATAWRERRPAV